MKKAIGILHNPDNGAGPLTIYYNGPGELIMAKNADTVEFFEQWAMDEEDARKIASILWGHWPWEYEELE